MTMVSIIIPAKNESAAIANVVRGVKEILPDAEIIVVDDGSSDSTAMLAQNAGARVISHPYSKGNGASIKTGARAAQGDILVFMDGDGQHTPSEILRLLDRLGRGYDMVVGARNSEGQASVGRSVANGIYNRLASYMTGNPVLDLTSGFRVVVAKKFREFIYLLPNGFSYPTTITMAFFRAGYSVAYEPITVRRRLGKSHIRIVRDGVRFLLIIFKIGTLYSPIKLFAPFSFLHIFAGLFYYLYTYFWQGRISLATIFLLTAGVTIFLIGLVSEQITQLVYKKE